MIAQLRGTLGDKRPNQVLVDVGGVGYLVHIPLSTFYALGDLHSNVTLLIHTQVREDAISLYGFLSAREKHLFELLISAPGVGPVLALKILSGMSVDDLVPAVRSGDLARLTRIPGVGRKTAERMIVELRDSSPPWKSPKMRASPPRQRARPETLYPRSSILATTSTPRSRRSSAREKMVPQKHLRCFCVPRCKN